MGRGRCSNTTISSSRTPWQGPTLLEKLQLPQFRVKAFEVLLDHEHHQPSPSVGHFLNSLSSRLVLPNHLSHVNFLRLPPRHLIFHFPVIFEFKRDLSVPLEALLLSLDDVGSVLLSLIGQKCENIVACSHGRIYILGPRIVIDIIIN